VLRTYAYKVVRGELRFENNEDEEKILGLMEVWRKTVNVSEHREWHMNALPRLLQRTADEFIEQQKKSMEAKRVKGEPVMHDWTVQLYPQCVRFSDDSFRQVSLTTLEPKQPVVAEFHCKRWKLLKEALNSPIREGCKKHHVLEVCNPKLTYDKRDRKLYLVYVIRKLVELPELKELEELLKNGFNVVSLDINLDDVTYTVFHLTNTQVKRLRTYRYGWNINEWVRVRRIDAWSRSYHGTSASRHWRTLKRRGTAKAGEAVSEVMKVAKQFDAEAIVYEKLSDRFPNKGRDYNYKIHMWYRGRIVRYLVNNAGWEGLAAFPVPARGTSSRCPRCNAELSNPKTESHSDWQVRRCGRCGFTDDRDHIACTNIARKFYVRLLKLRLRDILLQCR